MGESPNDFGFTTARPPPLRLVASDLIGEDTIRLTYVFA
jgi:hypothetical protein